MPKETEVVHEIQLPDNTFAVFYHYNIETDSIEVFLGDFACDETKETEEYDRLCVLGTAVENALGEAIEQAMMEIGESGIVESTRKIFEVKGNVIHANFSKRIH